MSPANRQATARADSGQSYSPATGAARETQLAEVDWAFDDGVECCSVPNVSETNAFGSDIFRVGDQESMAINQGKCHCWRDRHGSQDKERQAIANLQAWRSRVHASLRDQKDRAWLRSSKNEPSSSLRRSRAVSPSASGWSWRFLPLVSNLTGIKRVEQLPNLITISLGRVSSPRADARPAARPNRRRRGPKLCEPGHSPSASGWRAPTTRSRACHQTASPASCPA